MPIYQVMKGVSTLQGVQLVLHLLVADGTRVLLLREDLRARNTARIAARPVS